MNSPDPYVIQRVALYHAFIDGEITREVYQRRRKEIEPEIAAVACGEPDMERDRR